MHTVALAAGEHPDLFLLVGAGEAELRHVGARVQRAAGEQQVLLAPLITSQIVFPAGRASRLWST